MSEKKTCPFTQEYCFDEDCAIWHAGMCVCSFTILADALSHLPDILSDKLTEVIDKLEGNK